MSSIAIGGDPQCPGALAERKLAQRRIEKQFAAGNAAGSKAEIKLAALHHKKEEAKATEEKLRAELNAAELAERDRAILRLQTAQRGRAARTKLRSHDIRQNRATRMLDESGSASLSQFRVDNPMPVDVEVQNAADIEKKREALVTSADADTNSAGQEQEEKRVASESRSCLS